MYTTNYERSVDPKKLTWQYTTYNNTWNRPSVRTRYMESFLDTAQIYAMFTSMPSELFPPSWLPILTLTHWYTSHKCIMYPMQVPSFVLVFLCCSPFPIQFGSTIPIQSNSVFIFWFDSHCMNLIFDLVQIIRVPFDLLSREPHIG